MPEKVIDVIFEKACADREIEWLRKRESERKAGYKYHLAYAIVEEKLEDDSVRTK